MYVEYTEFLGVEDAEVPEGEPTVDSVLRLFDSMSWQRLSMISVSMENGQTMEVSGSKTDGLSLIHIDGDISFISKDAPDREAARAALRSFSGGHQGWRDLVEMMPFEGGDPSSAETEFVRRNPTADRFFWLTALALAAFVLFQMI